MAHEPGLLCHMRCFYWMPYEVFLLGCAWSSIKWQSLRLELPSTELETNWRPPPPPIKTVHMHGIKRGGFACHVFGSACHIFFRNPLILRDSYRQSDFFVWDIFGAYFSQIWEVGVVRIVFRMGNLPGATIKKMEIGPRPEKAKKTATEMVEIMGQTPFWGPFFHFGGQFLAISRLGPFFLSNFPRSFVSGRFPTL